MRKTRSMESDILFLCLTQGQFSFPINFEGTRSWFSFLSRQKYTSKRVLTRVHHFIVVENFFILPIETIKYTDQSYHSLELLTF